MLSLSMKKAKGGDDITSSTIEDVRPANVSIRFLYKQAWLDKTCCIYHV